MRRPKTAASAFSTTLVLRFVHLDSTARKDIAETSELFPGPFLVLFKLFEEQAAVLGTRARRRSAQSHLALGTFN